MLLSSPTKRRDKRAIIIGGSMSGLFTAAFLRKIGWDVDVYERSRLELVGRGAGITSHPELMKALESSGAGTTDLGVAVTKRITIDSKATIVGERFLPQILTSWDRLHSLLRQTIEQAHYHLGHTFTRVDQDANGVRVHFAQGGVEEADLLVGCDGIRSGVRAQVAPEVQPIYAGYYIWRGTPNEADLTSGTLESIFPYYVFYLPHQQQVLGYPIAGLNNDLRSGHRRYNLIWYRAGDLQKLQGMCVDEQGLQHKYSVPPPLVRKDLIAELHAEAEELLPAPLLDCLRNVSQPFFTPIYDFSSPTIVFGRIALVGDAASTARPHVGFGVSKAGVDAQALAAALDRYDDIDAALAKYNSERQPIGERIVQHARRLGAQLGVGLKTDEDFRMWKLLQNHDAMMDHIAVPNFLGQ
jgi:2-polyprenyl-6-methoxyphenol hydroxylase-like FAD-dependent oxidoreductase